MYLSKVHIDWEFTQNTYQYHRALWQCFPNRPDEDRSFLFRVEQVVPEKGAVVLMQSSVKPESTASALQVVAMRKIPLAFQVGQRLRFRLRANPIKAIKDPRKGTVTKKGQEYTKSVKVPIVDDGQLQHWIERKFAGAAVIESLLIRPEQALNFRKPKEQRSGKIQPVLFDGLLSVTDADDFLELFKGGIGPAKSFGCGMLSLAGS